MKIVVKVIPKLDYRKRKVRKVQYKVSSKAQNVSFDPRINNVKIFLIFFLFLLFSVYVPSLMITLCLFNMLIPGIHPIFTMTEFLGGRPAILSFCYVSLR